MSFIKRLQIVFQNTNDFIKNNLLAKLHLNFKVHFLFLLIFLIFGTGIAMSYAIVLSTNRITKPVENPLEGTLDSENNQLYLLNAPINNLKEIIIRRHDQKDLIFKPRDLASKRLWYLASPYIKDADPFKIWDFIARILNMKLDKLIDTLDSDDLTLKDYGFYNPYMVITANTVDGDSKIFMVGDRVDELSLSRYVYSNQYHKLGIISSSMPFLEKSFSYFYKSIFLLEKNDELLGIKIKDKVNNLELSIDKKNNSSWILKIKKNSLVSDGMHEETLAKNTKVGDKPLDLFMKNFISAMRFNNSERIFLNNLEYHEDDSLARYELELNIKRNKENFTLYLYLFPPKNNLNWFAHETDKNYIFMLNQDIIDMIRKLFQPHIK